MRQHQPWAVINAVGFVKVDDAESQPDICFKENAYGPVILAEACLKYGAQFLTFSVDLVFDGASHIPYVETSRTAPLNVYGASKRDAETHVLAAKPSALVMRTSAFLSLGMSIILFQK